MSTVHHFHNMQMAWPQGLECYPLLTFFWWYDNFSREFTFSLRASFVELPIPPNLHGSSIKFLSSSDIRKSLNKAGINFCWMTLSKCNITFSVFSVVLTMDVTLCLYTDIGRICCLWMSPCYKSCHLFNKTFALRSRR